jgi:DNA primase
MGQDVEALKRRLPLLDYLRRQDWQGRPVGAQHEFVGLCPLHRETHPSFYVNAAKNVFYCHGCGRGGDLIRFVQLSRNLSFREALLHLQQQLGGRQPTDPTEDEALRETVHFYQQQLACHPEAWDYLRQRGLHDPTLIQQLSIGYAPGGILYRHLSRLGYPADLLGRVGLVQQGRDAFYRRLVFPCFEGSRPVNLYGRSTGNGPPHRFLPRPKGGLFAWGRVDHYPELILVEGLLDLAALWQAGFLNTSCAFGVHLTDTQFAQLCNRGGALFIAFDSDPAGQKAAQALAQRLQSSTPVQVRIVDLPAGQDPNSWFVGGASAADFQTRLRQARCP